MNGNDAPLRGDQVVAFRGYFLSHGWHWFLWRAVRQHDGHISPAKGIADYPAIVKITPSAAAGGRPDILPGALTLFRDGYQKLFQKSLWRVV